MMVSLKNSSTLLKLFVSLVIGGFVYLALWVEESEVPPLLAQEPTATPYIGDIEIIAIKPPPQPTPLPTPLPDHKPPQTSWVPDRKPNHFNWYRTPVTFTFKAVDDWTGLGSTWYKLANETDWTRRESSYPPVVVTREGTHTLVYYSEDKMGNSETPITATLNIDLTPPTATHRLTGVQLPQGKYSFPITFTFTGQDNLSGLDHYEVKLDHSDWLTVTAVYTVTSGGEHTLTYRALDRAGNVGLEGMAVFVIEAKQIYLPLVLKR